MFDDDNPFCEGGKDTKKSGVSQAQATSILLFIYSIAMFFVIP